MVLSQPGILAPLPPVARTLTFQLLPGENPAEALRWLATAFEAGQMVVGIGPSTVARLGKSIAGLREPSVWSDSPIAVPVAPLALWIWLRGTDRGQLLHVGRALAHGLSGAYRLEAVTDTFAFKDGRDLSDYIDGTENPIDQAAETAAIVSGSGPGLDGSSFLALQTWLHDLNSFEALSAQERDFTIGRRHSDNEELASAPASAHVKRTAQEDFEPEAFVVRRSMPWSEGNREGLVFKAFACSLSPFEAQLRRMLGLDDGIVDALFRFTRPLGTSYLWCPPCIDGALDLRALL